MWKKILHYIKPFTLDQNPISYDSFDSYLDHIQKSISSQNLSDSKIISARATKKAIEKISTSMSVVITVNPIHAKKGHSKINYILNQFLIPAVDGDLRKSAWNNVITIITACDSVVDYQQWSNIIESAFFLKNLRNITDVKMGEMLADQLIAITNNINISTNPLKFNYWMNIISQFIFPIFWGNYKCIDKKCLNSLVIPFLSFFIRNMAIPNSIPTLSSLHKNPLIPYYTMEILIQAEQMLPTGKQVEFTELHSLLLRFLQSTFPIKISLNNEMADVYPDIPKNSHFKDLVVFLINKQVNNLQNHSFVNQIVTTATATTQNPNVTPVLSPNIPTITDSIIESQLVGNGKSNMQLILTFFSSESSKQSAAIIMQMSKLTNIFPEIILVLSTLFYRLTEALLSSLIKKATLSTTSTNVSKSSKRVHMPKQKQQNKQQQNAPKQKTVEITGLISNDVSTSDNSDLSFDQSSTISTDSDPTTSSSYQNFLLGDLSTFDFNRSPSNSSISSLDNFEISSPSSLPSQPNQQMLASGSTNPVGSLKRHNNNQGNQDKSQTISGNNSAASNQQPPPKPTYIFTLTTITTVTTVINNSIIQSYIDLFGHLLHLRLFFSTCSKNISPEKLGSTLFGSIFTCQNKFCSHQIACILLTVFFDSIRYTPENLKLLCDNLNSLSHSFDLLNETQEIFNLYSAAFATICSRHLLQMDKKSEGSLEEFFLTNPVYYSLKSPTLNQAKIPYLFFLLPLNYTNVATQPKSTSFSIDFNVPLDSNLANNLASTVINGFGKYNNYMHTAKFVDVLFSIYLMSKKNGISCNSSYIYDNVCPLLFDFFLQEDEKEKSKAPTKSTSPLSKPIMNTLSKLFEHLIYDQSINPQLSISWLNFFFESIKIASINKTSLNDKEIAMRALSTCMKCCCSPFTFRYSVIPFVNSHILIDYTSIFSPEAITLNFLDQNSYINNLLRYLSSTIEISRNLKETHIGSNTSFPLSLQFFNEFVTDSQFRLTPSFYTNFFFIFQSQIANDDVKKMMPSIFSIIKRLVINLSVINHPECFLNLISVLPYHYDEIKSKCPDLIPLLFTHIKKYAQSNQCSMISFNIIIRFIVDLLIYFDVNDPLFEKLILFLLKDFGDNESKNKVRDECFNFFLSKFLSNYRKKSSDTKSKKEKQIAIVDSKSTIITLNLYSTSLTVSNAINTDNYTVKVHSKNNEDNSSIDQKQKDQAISFRFKDHSLGSLIMNNQMNSALLFDAFLSQKREKHWLIFTSQGLELADCFNDRPSMEKHIIPIVFVKNNQRSIDNILNVSIDQTSSDFVDFLMSLGQNIKISDSTFIRDLDKLIALLKPQKQHQRRPSSQILSQQSGICQNKPKQPPLPHQTQQQQNKRPLIESQQAEQNQQNRSSAPMQKRPVSQCMHMPNNAFHQENPPPSQQSQGTQSKPAQQQRTPFQQGQQNPQQKQRQPFQQGQQQRAPFQQGQQIPQQQQQRAPFQQGQQIPQQQQQRQPYQQGQQIPQQQQQRAPYQQGQQIPQQQQQRQPYQQGQQIPQQQQRQPYQQGQQNPQQQQQRAPFQQGQQIPQQQQQRQPYQQGQQNPQQQQRQPYQQGQQIPQQGQQQRAPFQQGQQNPQQQKQHSQQGQQKRAPFQQGQQNPQQQQKRNSQQGQQQRPQTQQRQQSPSQQQQKFLSQQPQHVPSHQRQNSPSQSLQGCPVPNYSTPQFKQDDTQSDTESSESLTNKNLIYVSYLDNLRHLLSSADTSIYYRNCRHELLFVPSPCVKLQNSPTDISRIYTAISIVWYESPYDFNASQMSNSIFTIVLRPVSGGMTLVNVCSMKEKLNKKAKERNNDDRMKMNFIPFGSAAPSLVQNSILGFVIRDLVIIINNHINNLSMNCTLNRMNNSQQNKAANKQNEANLAQQSERNSQAYTELTLSDLLLNETQEAYDKSWSVLDQLESLF